MLAHRKRLDNAVFLDGVGQLLQGLFVELCPRLLRIDVYEVDIDGRYRAYYALFGFFVGMAQGLPVIFLRHHRIVGRHLGRIDTETAVAQQRVQTASQRISLSLSAHIYSPCFCAAAASAAACFSSSRRRISLAKFK